MPQAMQARVSHLPPAFGVGSCGWSRMPWGDGGGYGMGIRLNRLRDRSLRHWWPRRGHLGVAAVPDLLLVVCRDEVGI